MTTISKTDEEAYSPSRSFTPPPQQLSGEGIPFLDSGNIPDDISIPSNLHEILASIKKVDDPVSKSLDLKYDPIVQAYSKTDESYSPDDKPSPLSVTPMDEYIPTVVTPEEDSSQASTVLSKDSAKDSVTKVSRDPRQRNEPGKKSSLSQLSDDELIKKAAEMGFLNEDEKECEGIPEELSTDLEQPPPPGLEEEYDIDIRSGESSNLVFHNLNQPPPFAGFPVIPPPNVGPPVLAHGPIGQSIMPPMPPAMIMHGPMPPPPYPQGGFVPSNPVYQQGLPPLPPPPPSVPPPPPPPPPTGAPFPPTSYNVQPPMPPQPHRRQMEQEHTPQGSSSLKQTLIKSHFGKKDFGKRKLQSYEDDTDSSEKLDSVRKKRSDGGGVWKREVPTSNREFSSRSRGDNFTRGQRSGSGSFSGRNNRGHGFENRGRGNYFRGYSHSQRGYQSKAPPGSIQSEWDEEIRHFEQTRERRHKKMSEDRHWNRGGAKGKKRKYPPEDND